MKILKSDPISVFGGANFVFEYLDKMNIEKYCNEHLPGLATQCRYSWKDVFYSLKSVYLCGGDCVEDLQEHLKEHFLNNPLVNLAGPDTVLRRLSQLTEQTQTCKTKRGVVTHQYCRNSRLENLNMDILKRMGVFKADELTIDYDNTIIFNEKQDSKMSYKKAYGYQPGVCTINEENILFIENRNGNSDAKSFQVDTLGRMFDMLANKKINKIHNFRADAASYQYDVISLLQKKVHNFYIGCRNSYVEKYFSKVSNWGPIEDKDGFLEVGDIAITPFQKYIKSGNGDASKFRLVVKRKPRKDTQLDLLTQDAHEYRAILTNDFDKAPREVAAFYNQRGNMERQFDILKNDFGWNNMPFSSLNKNLVFLYFTAIYRNLYNKVIGYFSGKHDFLAPTDRMKKFIFRFITLPAKWVEQGRGFKLRIYSVKDYQT